MKKIKASQAKSAADIAKATHDSKVLTDIYKKIDEVTKKGIYHLAYNGIVSIEVQGILRAEGYQVSATGGRHGELGIEINWTSPSN